MRKTHIYGSKNWGVPLTIRVALTTVLHYRADSDTATNTRNEA